MALFGKKKASKEEPAQETLSEETVVEESTDEEAETENKVAEEKTPEEEFKDACAFMSKRLRLMFPAQMLIGFYYGELQEDGYIDDFCCYAKGGRLIEKQEIPSVCKISLPDMVSREEKLEEGFFKVRRTAEAFTEKPCNALSLIILGDGQVKIDITSAELKEGEEDIRYAKWRKNVEANNPRYMPPKIAKEKLEQIQKRTEELYRELGTEFYSYLPDEDFRVGYFYAEIGENGVFHFTRLVTTDGEIVDDADIFTRFNMDAEQAAKDRVQIVKLIMQIRQIFIEAKEKPFTSITLSVSGKGEFQSHLGFGPVDAAGEQERFENWKAAFRGISPSKNK